MRKLLPCLIIFLSFTLIIPVFTEGRDPYSDARYQALTQKAMAQREEAIRLARAKGLPIRVELPGGGVRELQKLQLGMPQYLKTDNVDAAHSTRTDSVNYYVGGGSGFTIGIWDGGHTSETHIELAPRVSSPSAEGYQPINHATHVGGTMIAAGVNPLAKGMAYEATLHSFNWVNDLGEMNLRALLGLILSNHSYSPIRGWDYDSGDEEWYWWGYPAISETEDFWFGRYDEVSEDLDQFAVDFPYYLAVFTAGNNRGDGPPPGTGHWVWNFTTEVWEWSTTTRDIDGAPDGYDCIPNAYAVAKNVLTVGAVFDVVDYTGPGDVVMTWYSGWGPTDDGRIKPDIVGNGHELFSPITWTEATGFQDTLYNGTYYGTSMAAPNVTGSLALLQKYYHDQHGVYMKAATLKALALHTAREAGDSPGPDYKFGWGLLDTYGAYQLINQDINAGGGLIEENSLSDAGFFTTDLYCDGSSDIKVTICWTDPPGTEPVHIVDPPTPMLVNDLDLRVTKYGGTTHMPWTLDRLNPANPATTGDNDRDNIEQVFIAGAEEGHYTITINHKGSLSGGSQDYALIISGAERQKVWHVYDDGSGDAPTIAAAVDSAVNGDYIIAHAGTFYEHDIEVDEELNIIGLEGSASVIVDAQSAGRCFNFTNASNPVTLEGFTLRNGLVSGTGDAGAGGALFCRPNIDIADCVIVDSDASEAGGGVYCDAGSNVSMTDCVVSGNTAGLYGGGIMVNDAGMLALDGCTVSGNEATTYDGGGVCAWDTYLTADDCTIENNTTGRDGGGIYSFVGSTVEVTNSTIGGNTAGDQGGGVFNYALLTLENSTVVGNEANTDGAGLHLLNPGSGGITRSIVAFNVNGYGIYSMSSTITISCSDVYGNEDGNYGGNLPDQTGSNDNISLDPLFCDFPGGDYTLADASPCTPAASPCGQLIGRYGVGCSVAPDLLITEVGIPEDHPVLGTTITMTVTVKNVGSSGAGDFYVDYYEDRGSAPTAGQTGDQRHYVSTLAAGDSVVWTTGPIGAACFGQWDSYFLADSEGSVAELNETNNASGPHEIFWTIPSKPGWAVAGGDDFHSSPAIAALDGNPATQEVVIGCDDGYLYAWDSGGVAVPGWPVDVGDTVFSSPAVGDIRGDYHNEVVVGCVDGYLYAYDYQGTEVWIYNAGQPVYTTPALADLDGDGKLEVIFAVRGNKGGGYVTVLEGNDASTYPGAWPVSLAGPGATSPAVGDVNDDGDFEIAVVSYGLSTPSPHSDVYLLRENGADFGVSWPVTIDTVVTAAPVLGDVAGTIGGPLEIVVGGLNGAVYAISTAGVVWPSPPRVPGMIERSPVLVNYDKEPYLEILVSSRYWRETIPPFGNWRGYVTLIENTGSIVAGWPNFIGSWTSSNASPSPIAFGKQVVEGSPGGYVHGWAQTGGDDAAGFPHWVSGSPYSSAAAGDLDGDGHLEIVVGTSMNAVYCFDMSCSDDYLTSVDQDWMMFRHDRKRTGCYVDSPATGIEDGGDRTPSATVLRSVYPNPFNPVTRIAFELASRSDVNITIYDISGRKVRELKNGVMDAGSHEVVWRGMTDRGRPAVSGVYFCRMVAGDVVQTRKMILLK